MAPWSSTSPPEIFRITAPLTRLSPSTFSCCSSVSWCPSLTCPVLIFQTEASVKLQSAQATRQISLTLPILNSFSSPTGLIEGGHVISAYLFRPVIQSVVHGNDKNQSVERHHHHPQQFSTIDIGGREFFKEGPLNNILTSVTADHPLPREYLPTYNPQIMPQTHTQKQRDTSRQCECDIVCSQTYLTQFSVTKNSCTKLI